MEKLNIFIPFDQNHQCQFNEPTYHFHENPWGSSDLSRHYGEVQWLFSPLSTLHIPQ
jgi:hypothetical protein